MDSGQRNKRVTFQAKAKTDAGGGAKNVAWVDVVTVWGRFVPERGLERLAGGRLQAELAGILTVLSSSETRAITPDHRVMIDGVAHQIRSIANPDQRNEDLEMLVERGAAT